MEPRRPKLDYKRIILWPHRPQTANLFAQNFIKLIFYCFMCNDTMWQPTGKEKVCVGNSVYRVIAKRAEDLQSTNFAIEVCVFNSVRNPETTQTGGQSDSRSVDNVHPHPNNCDLIASNEVAKRFGIPNSRLSIFGSDRSQFEILKLLIWPLVCDLFH